LATRISQTKFFGPAPAQHGAIALDEPPTAVALLRLPATASAENGTARANHINILGVPDEIWKVGGGPQMTNLLRDSVALNEALATQLGVKLGDTILLRVRKPTALSQDAVISPRSESSVALRLNVQSIVPAAALGNFNLNANQIPPLNAFVRLDELATRAGIPGRANLLLNGQITKQADIPSPVFRLGRLLAAWAERIWPSLLRIVAPDLMDSTNRLHALSYVLAQTLEF